MTINNGLLIEETKLDGSFNVVWRQTGIIDIEDAFKNFENLLKINKNHLELWRKAEKNEGPWLLAKRNKVSN